MANTGDLEAASHTGWTANGNNTIDSSDTTYGSLVVSGTGTLAGYTYSYRKNYGASASTSLIDVAGGSGTATVDGLVLVIRAADTQFFEGARISIEVSIDGQSGTYSSTGDNQDLTDEISATDYTFGGSSDTWGLDWSGWDDLGDLSIRITADVLDNSGLVSPYIYDVGVDIYYTLTVPTPPKQIHINAGTTHIGGNTTIHI